MRSAIKNVLWQLTAQGFNLFIPIITLRLVLSEITFNEYGNIALMLSLTGFIKVIIDFGYSIKGVSILYQEKGANKEKTAVFEIFIVRVLTSIIGTISVIFIFLYLNIGLEILPFLALIFFSSSFNLNYLFNYQEKSQYFTFISFLEKSILLILLFFVFKTNINVSTYFLSLSVSSILTGIINIFYFLEVFKNQRIEFHFKHLKYLLNLGKRQLQFNFINCVYTFSIIPLITLTLGSQSAGIYSAAEKIIKAFQIIIQPIINGLQKYILGLKKNKKLKFFYSSLILIIPLVLLIIIFSTPLSKLISNSHNFLISKIIQILSIGVLSSYSLSYVTINIFTPLNAERKISRDFAIILTAFFIIGYLLNFNSLTQFSWLVFCFELSLLILVFKNLMMIPNVKEI